MVRYAGLRALGATAGLVQGFPIGELASIYLKYLAAALVLDIGGILFV